MGRAYNLNNMIKDYQSSFDKAEAILGQNKENNINYAKFLTIKAVASKKNLSTEETQKLFEEALRVHFKIIGTRENILIYNIIFEIGEF